MKIGIDLDLAKEVLKDLTGTIEAMGGCDHSVGICACALIRRIETLSEQIEAVEETFGVTLLAESICTNTNVLVSGLLEAGVEIRKIERNLPGAVRAALDLIDRQKREIERLTDLHERL